MTETRSLTADSAIDRIFGPVIHPQTWINILYLLASFPLGVLYYAVIVALLSTGLGLLPIFVGVFILWALLLVTDFLSNLERRVANAMLGAAIPPLPPAPRVTGSIFDRMKATGRRPGIVKRLVYLFIRFPMGILSFCAVMILLPLSVILLTLPLTYGIIPVTVGFSRVETFDEAIYWCCFGAVFTLLSVHALNSWASVCRRFARVMLG